MIRCIVPVILIILSSLILRVHCLSAIPGSPCYDTCNGNQATSSGDIVCTDDDFQNTRKGRLLSTCLSCLSSSTFKQGFIADNVLFLYYLSTVQQTCLSGKPAEPISDCSGNCKDLSSSFSNVVGGRGFFQSPYAYCNASNSVYEDDAPDCAKCLRGQEGTVGLGNFVYAGNSACINQPDLLNGDTIPGASQLFNLTVIPSTSSGGKNGTTSSSPSSSSSTNSTVTSTTQPSSLTTSSRAHSSGPSATSASSSVKDSQDNGVSSGLSRGAAAGIGIALGIVGVALIVFIALLARRRLIKKQSRESKAVTESGSGPWKKMRDSPEMRQTTEASRRATPPAPGVYVPPIEPPPKKSKSFKSLKSFRSLKSLKMTPRTSEWYNAANPKSSSDVTALPQRGWD